MTWAYALQAEAAAFLEAQYQEYMSGSNPENAVLINIVTSDLDTMDQALDAGYSIRSTQASLIRLIRLQHIIIVTLLVQQEHRHCFKLIELLPLEQRHKILLNTHADFSASLVQCGSPHICWHAHSCTDDSLGVQLQIEQDKDRLGPHVWLARRLLGIDTWSFEGNGETLWLTDVPIQVHCEA